jgi:hypothetical protein
MICTLHKYYLGVQIEKNEIGGACSTCGERRDAYRVLVGKSEGKRPVGRQRRRWEDNIKIDLQEVEWGTLIGLIWLRIRQLVGSCDFAMNLRFP